MSELSLQTKLTFALFKIRPLRFAASDLSPFCLVSSRELGIDDALVDGVTVEDLLEVLFRQLNRVDGSELISRNPDRFRGVHSLSSGDFVEIRAPGHFVARFVCESVGWRPITLTDAQLLQRIVHRDWWGSMDETRRRKEAA